MQDEFLLCQSTYLVKASSPILILDVRQYIWDIGAGTFRPLERLRFLLLSLNFEVRQFLSGGKYLPPWRVRGNNISRPTLTLNLQPGEFVEVKTKEEIIATLDPNGKNRGLEFTPEMLKFCGKKFRVLKRVDKMMLEETGKLRQISNTVLLDNVFCDGKCAAGCQRTCYCLWREIWLKRVE